MAVTAVKGVSVPTIDAAKNEQVFKRLRKMDDAVAAILNVGSSRAVAALRGDMGAAIDMMTTGRMQANKKISDEVHKIINEIGSIISAVEALTGNAEGTLLLDVLPGRESEGPVANNVISTALLNILAHAAVIKVAAANFPPEDRETIEANLKTLEEEARGIPAELSINAPFLSAASSAPAEAAA